MTFRASHLYGNGPEVQGAFGVDSLPLTTVAHIISFLDDDVASLARLCRTSRVLWYMTLPHLWKNVTLKSHSTIRYKDDVPEGIGSASPFSMGLNALVTRNVSSLVRSLSLKGEFDAADLHEHARAGRVPESIMILNIAFRAALDQCSHLEKFRWDLNVRIQPNVYAGLAKLLRLEDLYLRFPTNRSPQLAYEIPPFPNIRSLTFTHYDPLCFPDDVSTLLLHATKLQSLTMHFSPRMREQGEPSVVLTHFFRKNIAAKRKLRLRSMSVYNLLNRADHDECLEAVDTSGIEHFTILNTLGEDEDAPVMDSHSGGVSATYFIDRTWHFMVKSQEHAPKPKSLRMDHLHRRHVFDMGKFVGLERLYLVNARYKPKGSNGVEANGNGHSDSSPDSASHTLAERSPHYRAATNDHHSSRITPTRTPSTSNATSLSLRDLYLDNICNVCGPTLQHLILPARWLLSSSITARLIRSCPNLTQLAAAVDCLGESQGKVLRLLMPLLSNLWAIRVLAPTGPEINGEDETIRREGYERFMGMPDYVHEEKMATSLAERCGGVGNDGNADLAKLRYIGLGWKIWEVGAVVEEVVTRKVDCEEGHGEDGAKGQMKEEVVYKRKLRRIEEKDVQHVEIWKMDSLDVV